jgi:hypothetical protein
LEGKLFKSLEKKIKKNTTNTKEKGFDFLKSISSNIQSQFSFLSHALTNAAHAKQTHKPASDIFTFHIVFHFLHQQ